MEIFKTCLPGVLIIEPKVFKDSRGYFLESFQTERYKQFGIGYRFVQDNHSRSSYGVLRGLHYQRKRPQGKLVSCSSGAIYDVAVDIKPTSDTFGKYVGVELSDQNHRQLWIPPGYAHGFCVISDFADFHYKCTDFYFPEDEAGLIWDDADVGIDWPISKPLLNAKDKNNQRLIDIKKSGEES